MPILTVYRCDRCDESKETTSIPDRWALLRIIQCNSSLMGQEVILCPICWNLLNEKPPKAVQS
jgi:hypothetical protein